MRPYPFPSDPVCPHRGYAGEVMGYTMAWRDAIREDSPIAHRAGRLHRVYNNGDPVVPMFKAFTVYI